MTAEQDAGDGPLDWGAMIDSVGRTYTRYTYEDLLKMYTPILKMLYVYAQYQELLVDWRMHLQMMASLGNLGKM